MCFVVKNSLNRKKSLLIIKDLLRRFSGIFNFFTASEALPKAGRGSFMNPAPNPRDASNLKLQSRRRRRNLELGIREFSGAWSLVVWSLSVALTLTSGCAWRKLPALWL